MIEFIEGCERKKSKKKVLNQKCGSKEGCSSRKKSVRESNSIPGLDIDMWYGDEFEPMKYGADAYYGPDGYHGWIYSDSGKKIGDYTADDSLVVSDNFMVDWEE